MEKDVRRPRRPRAEEGPDDPARGHRRLQRVRLEPLVQIVGRAHGPQFEERVELLLVETARVPSQHEQRLQVARPGRERVWRHDAKEGFHGPRELVHERRKVVVRLRVLRGMAVQVAARLVVVGPAPQVVAVRERSHRALEREDLQPVPCELQIPDDLGPQQAYDVGGDGILEPREDFLRHGGSAHQMPALEHNHAKSGPGEIGGVDESVVAAPDDDRVVRIRCTHGVARFLSGSKNGVFATAARARRRRCSTVTSISSSVPTAADSASRCAKPR